MNDQFKEGKTLRKYVNKTDRFLFALSNQDPTINNLH